ncbi:proteasome subunit alpha type [Gregarina niphandrodes]|uniref:Proteasome subunit alpha type n=1 Tax=Gregarina niphandrodes TaxID=110365 RepID=A0A023BDL4_GRENI|nr:proteasome subunit alpha type [Gregarina niphandrodes]EZG89208.1 proteasome subunit alpha type [Gregarina niphandrodes]|eukprot:XP_011128498.1 proteasome subunit alpha type [Gregarina niphandrodes]
MSSDYGFSLTTFSPTGKLVQIEYALNAVNKQGRPALGIQTRQGVVIAAEKKVGSSIIDEASLSKVELIDEHIGCVYAGMPADFRVLLARARKEAAFYKREFGEPIPVARLVSALADVMQEFTQSGGVRPFGCSLFVAGCNQHQTADLAAPAGTPQPPHLDNDQDDNEQDLAHGACRLYQVDPSGTAFGWKATAVGKDSQNAKTFLEKRYRVDMSVEDAIHTALLTLKELCEGIVTETNIEVGVIDNESMKFKKLRPSEVKDYLREAE